MTFKDRKERAAGYAPLTRSDSLLGCVRTLVDRRRKPAANGESDPGILAASGLVAGEGLAGVVVAGLVAMNVSDKSRPPLMSGALGESVTLAALLLVCWFLYRAAASKTR